MFEEAAGSSGGGVREMEYYDVLEVLLMVMSVEI